ncbi:chaplin [Streptomyces sp. NBC_01803]|uniref:chaplin n=1 Tax=Streptomyces sp. NBC_01803 TaxID=2975946 RepID=UPI002DDC2BC2|nr:chaplin [Streptomyces sp. NBC_01803]WSA46866.1 chaplin [Streptomyces sp. NBC_01803]
MNTAQKAALVLAAAGAVVGATTGTATASGADAQAAAATSRGVLSGNNVQVPIGVPLNVVGNPINVVGLLNPAFGNSGVNA